MFQDTIYHGKFLIIQYRLGKKQSLIKIYHSPQLSMGRPQPRLIDQVRQVIRTKHYSIRTEESSVNWDHRFILFRNKRHPAQMGTAEVEAFLSDLAVNGKVAAPIQNQAFSAILLLYKEVLKQDLGGEI